jgi:hypothetical protein
MRFSDLLGEPDEPRPSPPPAGVAGGHVEPPGPDPDDPDRRRDRPPTLNLAFLSPVSDDLLPGRRRRRGQPPASGGRS